MLQAEERRSVKQKAQEFTSGQSRSRPDSGTVERCARQPRCTPKILCAFDAIALQLPKERGRPAVAQGAAAHGHVRHFGKPPFKSTCCLAALFLPSHPAWRIGRRPRWSSWSVERRLTWASRRIADSAPFCSTKGAPPWCAVSCPAPLDCAGGALITGPSQQSSQRGPCAGGALITAKSSSCSRALNTCAGGALITATSSSCSRALNTCAGGALMGGGANSLRTAIPGSPARCGGAALTGGAR